MAMQALILSIVACETSLEEIRALIQGCQLGDIGGTANTKYRDYAAEDILEALHAEGFDVQRAAHLEDDGASMLEITMFVPDERKMDVKHFILRSEECEAKWGVSVGDSVDVETKDGVLNIEFRGTVIGFKGVFAQVRDMDDDVFDVPLGDITAD